MTIEIFPFDIAEHLKTDADIAGFLKESAIEGDTSDFIHALSIAARAKGMTKVAQHIGISQMSLQKSLSANGNPGFEMIAKVCEALGVKLHVTAISL